MTAEDDSAEYKARMEELFAQYNPPPPLLTPEPKWPDTFGTDPDPAKTVRDEIARHMHSDPEERAVHRAIRTQDALEHAEAIGTPQGLRGLFPTNLVRTRIRHINPTDIQRTFMKQRNTPPASVTSRTDAPADTSGGSVGTPQEQGDANPAGEVDPAYQRITPERVPEPGPIEREGEQQDDAQQGGDTAARTMGLDEKQFPDYVPPGGLQHPNRPQGEDGEQGTPARLADPGPPPDRPQYMGEGAIPAAVDMLLVAAEARDRDAVQAVPTRNEQPAVAQYKANLLQWLDDLDAYNQRHTGADAQNGTDPDADPEPDGPNPDEWHPTEPRA